MPIGKHPTFVVLPILCVLCQACGVLRQVVIRFADLVDSARTSPSWVTPWIWGAGTTICDVAKHLGVSSDVIKDIEKRYLSRRFAEVRLEHGADFSSPSTRPRSQSYTGTLTIVMDLDTGAVRSVGGHRQGGLGAEVLLETAPRQRGQDRGGGHGHVEGLL